MNRGLNVAIIGATGAVGQELLAVLEQRQFPVTDLILFASKRSEGKLITWKGKEYSCRVLSPGCFRGVQMAFFDASDAVSREWVPQAAAEGTWVIDNSATFRMAQGSLLIVPEVNGQLLEERLQAGSLDKLSPMDRVISGPNCSTVQMVVALKPIRDHWGLRRVVMSSYQSTSGAGIAATQELKDQTREVLRQERSPKDVLKGRAGIFPHPIGFNCIPQIGGFKDGGITSEEQKIIEETQKLLALPQLRISATAVRVPTFSSHGESVNVECERSFEVDEVREVLRAAPGVIVLDEPGKSIYPTGVMGAGEDAVYVGRIRRDPSVEYGVNLWVVSDNIRKGAALNAVQVGEIILKALH